MVRLGFFVVSGFSKIFAGKLLTCGSPVSSQKIGAGFLFVDHSLFHLPAKTSTPLTWWGGNFHAVPFALLCMFNVQSCPEFILNHNKSKMQDRVLTQSGKHIFNPRWCYDHSQTIYQSWRNFGRNCYSNCRRNKNQQLPGLALNLTSPDLTFSTNLSQVHCSLPWGALCYDTRTWLQGLHWKASPYFFHPMACPLRGAFALLVRQYRFFFFQ